MTTRDPDEPITAVQNGAVPAGDPTAGGSGEPKPASTEASGPPGPDAPDGHAAQDGVGALQQLRAERDEHLDALRRVSADFANFRRRAADRETAAARRAEETLLRAVVLPVVDALDAARGHHADVVEPVWRVALAELERAGVERLDPLGKPFDPTEHDAVAADGAGTGPGTVSAVLRAGYRWRGQLLRPAQVQVQHQPDCADEAQPPADQT